MKHALIATAFDTGLRPSELLGLNIADFDRATSSLEVRASRYRGHRGPTKTRAAERSVEVSAHIGSMIAGIVGIRPPEQPIFPLRYGSSDRAWRRCQTSLGIRYRSPYQTKHTYATLALLEGASPAAVANKLGISLATLENYYAAAIRRGHRLTKRGSLDQALDQEGSVRCGTSRKSGGISRRRNAPDRIRT